MTSRRVSRTKLLAGAVGALAAAALAAYAARAPAQSTAEANGAGARTLRDGVFSRAQIERGSRQFADICMSCHEIEEFTGSGAYLEQVEGKTVWEVFEYIWAEMPEDDPASLDPNDYAAILAYVFSAYGLESGARDLPIDRASLERITITLR